MNLAVRAIREGPYPNLAPTVFEVIDRATGAVIAGPFASSWDARNEIAVREGREPIPQRSTPWLRAWARSIDEAEA